jgi:thioredoxin-related protein/outer membrane protein assembly factor BamD (BamD/ComL family)
MRTILRSCLLAGLTWLALPSLAAAEEVQWRTDYNTARKEAEKKGLPLVLDFGTENCFYCRKLDETTFRDPAVVKTLNEKFVPLKIDADREPALTQSLRIHLYPTLVLAAPDGKILGKPMEGYQDAAHFQESLQRALATVSDPEWMLRDFQEATKAAQKGDAARAIGLLRAVLEDGKARPVQVRAGKLLAELEQQAASRLAQAKQLQERGQSSEAAEALAALVRDFAGTQLAREAGDLLTTLGRNTQQLLARQRAQRARELLAQAQEDRKLQQFLSCLDRCELLVSKYGDLPEAEQAVQIAAEIKDNPEWMQAVCDSLGDRLSGLYLAQAETWVRRGQPQQAVMCLERLIQRFPGSRQAEVAQSRLTQLRGTAQPIRQAELQQRP